MKRLFALLPAALVLTACQPVEWTESASTETPLELTGAADFAVTVGWDGEPNVHRGVALSVLDLELVSDAELDPEPLELIATWTSPDGEIEEQRAQLVGGTRDFVIEDGDRGLCSHDEEGLCALDYTLELSFSRELTDDESVFLCLEAEGLATGTLGLYDDGPPPYAIDVELERRVVTD